MRKLWVKAWLTLDGVFDADTIDSWWQNTKTEATAAKQESRAPPATSGPERSSKAGKTSFRMG